MTARSYSWTTFEKENFVLKTSIFIYSFTLTVTQSENGKVSKQIKYDNATRIHPHVPRPSSVFRISSKINHKIQSKKNIIQIISLSNQLAKADIYYMDNSFSNYSYFLV